MKLEFTEEELTKLHASLLTKEANADVIDSGYIYSRVIGEVNIPGGALECKFSIKPSLDEINSACVLLANIFVENNNAFLAPTNVISYSCVLLSQVLYVAITAAAPDLNLADCDIHPQVTVTVYLTKNGFYLHVRFTSKCSDLFWIRPINKLALVN